MGLAGFSEAALNSDVNNIPGVRPVIVSAVDDTTSQNMGEDVIETEPQEAVTPKAVPEVNSPTDQERKEHELTHLPYRNWRYLYD